MYKIEGQNISLTFPRAIKPVLNDIDFSIDPGQITVFLGLSGSGKTTLLKCMAGIYELCNGAINYNGMKSVGYVSQQYQLFPHMTVYKNCTHPQRKVLGRDKIKAEETAGHFLSQFELLHLKDRYPSELSGGQQQRVAIARALGMGSQVLLLDEPTSALDPKSTEKLKSLLIQLKNKGYTIIITTHDMSFAESVMDHVYLMKEGTLIESFKGKNFPKTSQTYQFLNH